MKKLFQNVNWEFVIVMVILLLILFVYKTMTKKPESGYYIPKTHPFKVEMRDPKKELASITEMAGGMSYP